MRTQSLLLAAAVIVVHSGRLAAQQNELEPGHANASPPSADAVETAVPSAEEVAQIRQRLRDLQERARRDPAISAANEAFGNDVMAAMIRLDPDAGPKKARADAIQGEAAQARAASDNARLSELAEEGRALQAYFSALRTRALALPEVEQRRQAYITTLFSKMTELDPEAPNLVSRLDAAREAQQQAIPDTAEAPR